MSDAIIAYIHVPEKRDYRQEDVTSLVLSLSLKEIRSREALTREIRHRCAGGRNVSVMIEDSVCAFFGTSSLQLIPQARLDAKRQEWKKAPEKDFIFTVERWVKQVATVTVTAKHTQAARAQLESKMQVSPLSLREEFTSRTPVMETFKIVGVAS